MYFKLKNFRNVTDERCEVEEEEPEEEIEEPEDETGDDTDDTEDLDEILSGGSRESLLK